MKASHGEMHRRFEPKSLWGHHIPFVTRAFSKLSPGHQRQHLKMLNFGALYGRSVQFVFDESHRIVESPHGH